MMETPEQSWIVRFEMATCCEATRFEDRGFGSSDDKNLDFRVINPDHTVETSACA
jgi:hypothetical protein